MKKILVIGDIHLGVSRESTTHPGVFRQANNEAEDILKEMIPKFNEINPDLVMHMGDALRDIYKKDIDTANIQKTIGLLESINSPISHLVGNHELWAFSAKEIQDIYNNKTQREVPFYGISDQGIFNIMWLDVEVNEKKEQYLSQDRIQWIKEFAQSKNNNKPLVVFSHYSVVPIDSKGSFYFNEQPDGMYYKNHKEIRDAFSNIPAKLFINAHVHLLTQQKINGVNYISNPAFSENIAGEKFAKNNPGIYSILEIENNRFVFTTYSGDFCFGKIEGNI